MHVCTYREFIKKLEHKSVHMCGREHRDNALRVVKAWKNLLAELKV